VRPVIDGVDASPAVDNFDSGSRALQGWILPLSLRRVTPEARGGDGNRSPRDQRRNLFYVLSRLIWKVESTTRAEACPVLFSRADGKI
jgi:hypothetical protein